MNKITFIIPTIGRESLKDSIKSLQNQTCKNWNAIIIFDGVKCNIENNDKRIKIIEIRKVGLGANSAGLVRNHGISMVYTKWVAFLDDDDTISPDYIELFYNDIEKYNNIDLDVIIFRMKLGERIVPKEETDNFYLCDVGISFIIKKQIFNDGLEFIPDGAEDFLYLDSIRRNGYKMMISPYVKYFVKSSSQENERDHECKRVFINVNNPKINFLGYAIYNYYKRIMEDSE
jgi:glycosyltransferase involved in cell wall biosynthesis